MSSPYILRYPNSLLFLRISKSLFLSSISGFSLANHFCQYIYVALGKTVYDRISFNLKSLRRLRMVLAVLSDVLHPLKATSSVLLNGHSLFIVLKVHLLVASHI